MTGEKLLNVSEAAGRLGISPLTLRSWLRQGRLGYHRLGRRILLSPDDVERFIDQSRVEPAPFFKRGLSA
jgi:excisionase family DNA binding protein